MSEPTSRSAPESRVARLFLRLGCWWAGCEPRTGAAIWSSAGYDQATCRYCHRPIERRSSRDLQDPPAASPVPEEAQ